MTQVSHRYLPSSVSNQIFNMFLSTLTSLASPVVASRFIEDLLSPTEQLMLGKRLAIAYMLKKGYQQRTICSVLKVSLGTVSKISTTLKIKGNGYSSVIAHMLMQEKVRDFFDKLEEKLDHLLPPKGVNWHNHYTSKAEEKRKNKRTF